MSKRDNKAVLAECRHVCASVAFVVIVPAEIAIYHLSTSSPEAKQIRYCSPSLITSTLQLLAVGLYPT